MPPTVIRGTQVLDGSIQRTDLDVSTVGQAVVAKLVQGAGITLSSTGADSGTGDVTVASTVSTPIPVSSLTTVSVILGTVSTSQTVDCTGAFSVFVSLNYTAAITLNLTHLGQNTQVFLRIANTTAGSLIIKFAGTGPTGTALTLIKCVIVSQGAEIDLIVSGITLSANVIQYFQGMCYAGSQLFLMSL